MVRAQINLFWGKRLWSQKIAVLKLQSEQTELNTDLANFMISSLSTKNNKVAKISLSFRPTF